MPDAKLEKLLVEAMKNLLDQDDLGRIDNDYSERSHHVQFQWEDINDSFALKVKDSDFFDALNAAFYKIHSYKWIDDTTFDKAFTKELEAQGTPWDDIELGLKALEDVRNKYTKDSNENAVGWAENLDEIERVTQEPKDNAPQEHDKETFSGDNKPYSGVEPQDNTRPRPNEL